MKRKISGRATVAQRLRETTECECGSHKPAIVTKTQQTNRGIKVVGYCEKCIGWR